MIPNWREANPLTRMFPSMGFLVAAEISDMFQLTIVHSNLTNNEILTTTYMLRSNGSDQGFFDGMLNW